jgi:hypothetical protein
MEKINIPCSHCVIYKCFACVVNSNPLTNNNYFIPTYKMHGLFVSINSSPAEIKAFINSVPPASKTNVYYILTHSRLFQMDTKMEKSYPQKYLLRFSHMMERCVYVYIMFIYVIIKYSGYNYICIFCSSPLRVVSGPIWVEKARHEEYIDDCKPMDLENFNIGQMRQFMYWVEPKMDQVVKSKKRNFFELRREGMGQQILCCDMLFY